ncbi:uncharacterized protein LOC105391040 [Plutella xylostella]|uniref:uncharacterized protein LOC105391040 n=1 Tax=Plutella xylostella TaxID=51655 RepID=UPI0005D0AB39|nr:uncharacterized protein LOC105391040 [Plutella xylostella]XP_048488034.1 uncharacterized protein LOC105391040 [Plutella xylostella]
MLAMPSAHCPRVPPPHAAAGSWDALPIDFKAEDDLPVDPRCWSRGDVSRWAERRGAAPERFPMNGKALCLMSEDMFRAREPQRAAKMHQDFRRRLARAMALQDLVEKLQRAAGK